MADHVKDSREQLTAKRAVRGGVVHPQQVKSGKKSLHVHQTSDGCSL